MSLGRVCQFKLDKINKKDFNGVWFLGKPAPIAHVQGIHFVSRKYYSYWAFNSVRTRKWIGLFM